MDFTLFFEGLQGFLEFGNGVFNRRFLNAEGHAEVSRSEEAGAGDYKDIILLQVVHKGNLIFYGCLAEEVEGAFRFDELISGG
jgi:hypothetical protein